MKLRTLTLLATILLTAAVRDPGLRYELSELTSCRSGLSIRPRVSSDGRRVFFLSSCDLVEKNSDRSMEIFAVTDGKTDQLTQGSFCQVYDLAPAPDGERVAFTSNCPYRGKNPSQGIELMVREKNGEVQVLTQSRGREIRELNWSADGRYLYFVSSANLAKDNQDNSREIFVVEFEATPPAIRQVTRTLAPRGCSHPVPAPGAVIALCDEDFPETTPAEGRNLPITIGGRKPGGNMDHNLELFSFNLEGTPRQITYTENCKNRPAVADDQARVLAFVSDCNLDRQQHPPSLPSLYIYSQDRFTVVLRNLRFEPAELDLSGDGSALAFSSGLYTERLNRGRNLEIFILRLNELRLEAPAGNGNFPPGLHLVSDFPSGSVRDPSVSADGRVVAFAANANPDRKNPEGNFEIFLARQSSGRDAPRHLDGNDDPLPDDSEDEEAMSVDEQDGWTVEEEEEQEEDQTETDTLPDPADEPLLPPGMRLP